MQRTPTQRQRQARLFDADEDVALVAPPPIPAHPTAIVVAVSGGIDSSGAAIWARRRWPALPIILLHNHLEQFDWSQTDSIIGMLAERLGNCRRVTIQAVYELNGTITPAGANGTTLRRVHIVRDGEMWYGPARDNDAAAILTLMDLTMKARNGMPPTKKIRYCTEYMKIRATNAWLRQHRSALGDQAVFLSGERWLESAGRAMLPHWQWRFGTTTVADVLWLRPIVDLRLHEVMRMSVEAGVPIHPGYGIQGETLDALLDPFRDETKGRARLSCVRCIFSSPRHIRTALLNAPEIVSPYDERIRQYEAMTGYTWAQRGHVDTTDTRPALPVPVTSEKDATL